MNQIKFIEIMEYMPQKYLVKNFPYDKTAKIIKENI